MRTGRSIVTTADAERDFPEVWYANSDLRGELVKIVGIEKVSSNSDVTVTPLVQPGARLDGLRSNYSRLAEARAFASGPEQALTMAKETIKRLRVVVYAGPIEPDCF